ncbi:MAG TPA: hypothetical protein VIX90_00215, partial [Edaphobacter sp.]
VVAVVVDVAVVAGEAEFFLLEPPQPAAVTTKTTTTTDTSVSLIIDASLTAFRNGRGRPLDCSPPAEARTTAQAGATWPRRPS